MLSRLPHSSNTLNAYVMPGKYFLKIMTHVLARVDGMSLENNNNNRYQPLDH
jgi:hypothetical protein